MTPYPSELPDVSSYLDLIDRFIGSDISAPDFEKSFLRAMKSERRILGDPVYPILQELFEDADAYVEQVELRTEPEDLDDEQLLASALHARHALSGLGYE
jgi:Bacterial self-protective colicin-like immunity